jgi:hypothetical protein
MLLYYIIFIIVLIYLYIHNIVIDKYKYILHNIYRLQLAYNHTDKTLC